MKKSHLSFTSSLLVLGGCFLACTSSPELSGQTGGDGDKNGDGDGSGDGDGNGNGDGDIQVGDGDGDGDGDGPGDGDGDGDTNGDGDTSMGGAVIAPPWDYPDDVDFPYTPIMTGGDSCGSVEGTPESVSRPIDIIFVIDNSSSMSAEIGDVETNVKENFADIIEASGIDYRVILISRYGVSSDSASTIGHADYQICIPAPLGGHDCSAPYTTPIANGSRYFHYSADIESRDALCVILESFDEPDEFDNQNTGDDGAAGSVYRNWTSAAPNGWRQWLRPEAFKTFVVISDDDVECNTNAFSSYVQDQNFANLSFDDGPNNASDGLTVAEDFDAALRSLSAAHFGTEETRNYVWHSIIGLDENDPIAAPWEPTDDVVGANCSPGSSGRATGYQQLSRMTGGLRYPICVVDGGGDFNPIFDEIAQGVIETAAIPCEFDFPEVDGIINPANIKVRYAPSGGGDEVEFNRVTDENACTSGDDFYFDSNTNPTQLFLCGSACTLVQDEGGEITLDFGCLGN